MFRATMVRGIRRRYLVLAAIFGLLAGGAMAATSFATGASSRPQVKRSATELKILAIALRAAAGAGDPTPTLIQHSAGPRGKANLISSEDITGGQHHSYLIAERGHFVVTDSEGVPGSAIPRGSVLTLVVNAASGQVTDFGVQNNYPNLAALGPVTTDWRTAR